MTRQRRPTSVDSSNAKYSKKVPAQNEKKPPVMPLWKITVTVICLTIACCIGYMGYLETRVNTPFDDQKMVVKSGLDVPDRYWGSYRPGVYFGMKTRDPHSLVTGLMWYFTHQLRPDGGGIRHWCEQGDNLRRYSWVEHDGKNFGVQEIEDGPFLLTSSFVKRPGGDYGGDWTARIGVTSKDIKMQGNQVSLLLYTAIEEKTKGWIKPSRIGSRILTGVTGETEGLGAFSIKLFNSSGEVEHESYLSTSVKGLHDLKETVINALHYVGERHSKRKWIALPGELVHQGVDGKAMETNFVVTQVTAQVPFQIDVVFESASNVDRTGVLAGGLYSQELQQWKKEFQLKFEDTFHLSSKGYTEEEVKFAKAAFSNMIGGVGYFYGTSRVESAYTRGPVPYWKAALYSAVPSRSFFPRGFLWDEGFHGLLISAWNLDIELDILCHWFDLMNVEGWIPREQILGQEALSKVPEEFVTQRNSNANPPTFFLTLHYILKNFAHHLVENGERLRALERLYPRLQAWFEWFNSTQLGDLPGSYRWRGRDSTTNKELNPKTLTSGLDDYPRASHPNVDERHLDLRCWIALAAFTLSEIGKLLGRDHEKYLSTFLYLSDNKLMDELHWSPVTETYADFGLHTDRVELKRPPPSRHHGPNYHPPQNPEKIRVVLQEPELRFVDTTFGYVSLFPFLLQLLQPNSPKLNNMLDSLKSRSLLWTDFGLRSLAKSSPLYMKRNTEHDPPYWRAPIWININYLAVRALHHYSKVDGLYRTKAQSLYEELRRNVIANVFKEYKRTGYIWEQYNDKTGEGQGCKPFTGWSALVVLLMAELY